MENQYSSTVYEMKHSECQFWTILQYILNNPVYVCNKTLESLDPHNEINVSRLKIKVDLGVFLLKLTTAKFQL